MTLAPDLAEPVAAWRGWNATLAGPVHELLSPLQIGSWPPREASVARCARGCREPVSLGCTCGLYGSADVRAVEEAWSGCPGRVLGCTALWGRVIEHDAGYRGQFGYPLVLLVLADVSWTRYDRLLRWSLVDEPGDPGTPPTAQEFARRLADTYAVPVRVVPRPRALPGPETARWGRLVGLEAARGLAARRSGDARAHDRLDADIDELVRAWGGSVDR